MHPMPPDREPGSATGWAAVKEGFAFVRRNRLIQSTFVIDLIAMIFGMPQALFTFLAISQFHRGPEVVGLLFAAPAVGAFVGALTAGWVKNVRRQGIGRHLGRGRVGRGHHRVRAGRARTSPSRCSSSRSRVPPT